MPKLPALRKSLCPTAMLAGAMLVAFSMNVAQAQQGPKGNNGEQAPYYVQRGPQGGVGGYSLRLSDIWGPPKCRRRPRISGRILISRRSR